MASTVQWLLQPCTFRSGLKELTFYLEFFNLHSINSYNPESKHITNICDAIGLWCHHLAIFVRQFYQSTLCKVGHGSGQQMFNRNFHEGIGGKGRSETNEICKHLYFSYRYILFIETLQWYVCQGNRTTMLKNVTRLRVH